MIYVDLMGHMITDRDLDELHQFAKSLGLKREWFQDRPDHPHYDLTTKRMINKAIRHGATLVDPREIVRILHGKRL